MNSTSRLVVKPGPEWSSAQAVFNSILCDGFALRSDISQNTNLAAATVSRVTRNLIEGGVIEEYEQQRTGKPGRAHVALRMRADAGYVVGLSVNAFEQRVAIANLQRMVIAEEPLPRDELLNPDRAHDAAGSVIRKLIRRCGIDDSKVVAIGVASAGVVDSLDGTVIRAPTIGWTNVPFGRRLEKTLGIPVRVKSLVAALAGAEHKFGSANQYQNFIVVHATLGIGMGLVVDGHHVQGCRGQAGLVGAIPVGGSVSQDRRLTLDDVAGGAALYAAWRGLQPLNPMDVGEQQIQQLIEAANGGDKAVVSICEKGAFELGHMISTVVMTLDMEAIMLVGPLIRLQAYREMLKETIRRCVGREIEVVVSQRRGVEAAFMLAINELTRHGSFLNRLMNRS